MLGFGFFFLFEELTMYENWVLLFIKGFESNERWDFVLVVLGNVEVSLLLIDCDFIELFC